MVLHCSKECNKEKCSSCDECACKVSCNLCFYAVSTDLLNWIKQINFSLAFLQGATKWLEKKHFYRGYFHIFSKLFKKRVLISWKFKQFKSAFRVGNFVPSPSPSLKHPIFSNLSLTKTSWLRTPILQLAWRYVLHSKHCRRSRQGRDVTEDKMHFSFYHNLASTCNKKLFSFFATYLTNVGMISKH